MFVGLIIRPKIHDAQTRRPDRHLHVLAGAGHGALAERPVGYVEAVGQWLTDDVNLA